MSAKLNDSLVVFFARLHKNDDSAELIPPKVSFRVCNFHTLLRGYASTAILRVCSEVL